MPTVCATCLNLIVPEGARQKWWGWLCRANKMAPTFNPVTGKEDRWAPYIPCKAINDGNCPDYETGPTIVNPREMPK